ncbi:MAG: cation:dicarboxylase symporter family transporter [Planctomycetes bacterium]|nr:cation:dicarboxylase symporter family transporter [Planctomycetota bacterium]
MLVLPLVVVRLSRDAQQSAGEAANEIAPFDFIDQLVLWIPANPVEAFAAANMLRIIFFAIVVGIAVFSCNLYHVPVTLGGVLRIVFLGLARPGCRQYVLQRVGRSGWNDARGVTLRDARSGDM